jgi:non-heme chloroperoxidase
MEHEIKTAELATGVRLPYVEQGDAGGVPVVLLHGYSDSWRSFELLLGELPAAIHAFAPTQRGHGDADHPAHGYGPEHYAADLGAFLDAVGVERAVVAGHSGGSYAAQRFALDHPERTLAVVLIGAFRAFAGNPGLLELSDLVADLSDPVDPAFVREFQEDCVARPLPDGFMDAIVRESRKLPARVWQDWLRDHLAAAAPTDGGTIAAPTLVLWGDQDVFCSREEQDALVAAIPGARLVVYEGAGHCPHWEEVAATAAELAAFSAAAAEPLPV